MTLDKTNSIDLRDKLNSRREDEHVLQLFKKTN